MRTALIVLACCLAAGALPAARRRQHRLREKDIIYDLRDLYPEHEEQRQAPRAPSAPLRKRLLVRMHPESESKGFDGLHSDVEYEFDLLASEHDEPLVKVY